MVETHSKKRLVGYARVSTYGQTLDVQLEQLRAAGCSSRNIYREKVTGARADRRELNRMLGKLAPGDVVTVTRIDRLARSTFDLFAIIKRIAEAKAQFRSLTEPWTDTGISTGRLMLRYSVAWPMLSAILFVPAPPRAGGAPRPQESTWAVLLASTMRRRTHEPRACPRQMTPEIVWRSSDATKIIAENAALP